MKCTVQDCVNHTRAKNSTLKYCSMHLARLKRHGSLLLKKESGNHGLEKLPHSVDVFIRNNFNNMDDKQLVDNLIQQGIEQATIHLVKYRRRKLGIRRYLSGEILKHKSWIRSQAIKKYGKQCELCNYKLVIDAHHVLPKYKGGPDEVQNLMIVCPNCHALITRGIIQINTREEIVNVRKIINDMTNS